MRLISRPAKSITTKLELSGPADLDTASGRQRPCLDPEVERQIAKPGEDLHRFLRYSGQEVHKSRYPSWIAPDRKRAPRPREPLACDGRREVGEADGAHER